MLILEIHLVERGDEASLVPHRSWLGYLVWCEGHVGLHRRERHVGLRGRTEDPRTPGAMALLLDRRGALGCPWIIAEPGTHGTGLLCTSSATTRLGRAAVLGPLALALAATAAFVSMVPRHRSHRCCCCGHQRRPQ